MRLPRPRPVHRSYNGRITHHLDNYGSINFVQMVTTSYIAKALGCVAYGNAAPELLNPVMQSPKMDVFSFGVLMILKFFLSNTVARTFVVNAVFLLCRNSEFKN